MARKRKKAGAGARKVAGGGPEKRAGAVNAPRRKLYSVGEVVKGGGISRQVLHNYTVLGLLQPAERTPTNRRYYDESVFRRIEIIRRMLDSGYTLQSLREIFPWED